MVKNIKLSLWKWIRIKIKIIAQEPNYLVYFVKSSNESERPHKIVFYGSSFCTIMQTLTVQKQIFNQEPLYDTTFYEFFFEEFEYDFTPNISEFMEL